MKMAALLLFMLSSYSAQALEFTVNGIKYVTNQDFKTCRIAKNSGYGTATSPHGKLVIPEVAGKFTVTDMEAFAFQGCGYTEVELPSTLKYISQQAFENCQFLTKITVSEDLERIGSSAFKGCKALESFEVAGSSLTAIDTSAFQDCVALYSATFGSKGVAVYNSAFEGCVSLNSISLDVSTLGTRVFKDCTGLISATISGSAKEAVETFVGCLSLSGAALPGDVEKMYKTFSGCKSLQGFDMPSGVQSINYAFDGCESLGSIDIPQSVTEMDGTFRGCVSLKSVEVPPLVTELSGTYEGCAGLTSVVIPSNVNFISYNTFINCTSLKELRFEDSNVSISIMENTNTMGPFNNCPIEKIYFGRSWFYWGGVNDSMFPELKEVELGSSVVEMPENSFQDCTKLTSVSIPGTIVTLGDGAFRRCTGLTSVKMHEGTTAIGAGSFYGCTGLTSFDMPNTIETIGIGAFNGCKNLSNVRFSNNLKKISDYAFYRCGFRSFVAPKSLEEVGEKAFDLCGLTEVVLGPSVTGMGSRAFYTNAVQHVSITSPFPPGIREDTFSISSSQIDVDPRYLEAYTQPYAFYWIDFFNAGRMGTLTPPAGVAIDNTSLVYVPGGTATLTATIYPLDTTLKYIYWESSNPSIATVDDFGVVSFSHREDINKLEASDEANYRSSEAENFENNGDGSDETEDNDPNKCVITASTIYSDSPIASIEVTYSGVGVNEISYDRKIQEGAIHFDALGNRITPDAPGLHIIQNPDGTTIKHLIRR